jgi:hypothetical protein
MPPQTHTPIPNHDCRRLRTAVRITAFRGAPHRTCSHDITGYEGIGTDPNSSVGWDATDSDRASLHQRCNSYQPGVSTPGLETAEASSAASASHRHETPGWYETRLWRYAVRALSVGFFTLPAAAQLPADSPASPTPQGSSMSSRGCREERAIPPVVSQTSHQPRRGCPIPRVFTATGPGTIPARAISPCPPILRRMF